jgi:glycerol-3-phosphate dehydrogenase
VLARRLRLEVLNWQATLEAVPVVAALMAAELGWNAPEQQIQAEIYTRQIISFQQAIK